MCDSSSCHSHSHNHEHVKEDEQYGDDPYHPCVQKEKAAAKRTAELRAIYAEHDVARIAEQRRKGVISAKGAAQIPPLSVNLDYPALETARQEQQRKAEKTMPCISGQNVDETDSSDDEEWDGELIQLQMSAMVQKLGAHQELLARGYGVVTECAGKRVLTNLIQSFPLVIVHTRDSDASGLAAEIDLSLEAAAAQWFGTRFLRCNVRNTSACIEPTQLHALAAYENGSKICCVPVEGTVARDGDLEVGLLDQWLQRTGVLKREPYTSEMLLAMPCVQEAQAITEHNPDDVDDDDADFYDCGLDGCRKRFLHHHIGTSSALPGGLSHEGF